MNFDLSVLENNLTYLTKMVDMYFDCEMLSAQKVGKGFYGVVYLANIKKEPYKVILKIYKHSTRNLLENQQLQLLSKYSLLKVPQTYYVHNYSKEIPFDALIMEYIEGINAAKLPTDHPRRDAFADEMVENLIHLHSITNDRGFGFENVMYPDWKSCFGSRITGMHQILHENFYDRVSPYVMRLQINLLKHLNPYFRKKYQSLH